MKILINYEDWLLQIRSKIEPKVGDKIKTIAAIIGNQSLQNNIINKIEEVEVNEYFSKYQFKLFYRSTYRYIENCYVEIEYNPFETTKSLKDCQNTFDKLASRQERNKILGDGDAR